MDAKKVIVKVPASTANLGPGFDTIGMAFQLYTEIVVSRAETTEIFLYGKELKGLPADKSNLIYQVMAKLFAAAGEPMPNLKIEVESQIPPTRGLGSSASAIVAALAAANNFLKKPFSREQIYHIAAGMEGHPDNVGASMFGGIVVAAMEAEETPFIRIEPPEGLKAVAAIPDYELFTKKARDVLPEMYRREDSVHAISHASLLVAALATGKTELLHYAMKDRFHQPYRIPLVPGMDRILREASDHGALGVALSGAGPTMIALTIDTEEQVKRFMKTVLEECGVSCEVVTLVPDTQGVQVEVVVDIHSNP